MTPRRLETQKMVHWRFSGLKTRTVTPDQPFVGKWTSSTLTMPPKYCVVTLSAGNSSQSLLPTPRALRRRFLRFHLPTKVSKSWTSPCGIEAVEDGAAAGGGCCCGAVQARPQTRRKGSER